MIMKKWGLTGIGVLVIFIGASFLFFSPKYRSGLRGFFAPPEREILSVASGKLFPENKNGRVVKLATPAGITLEVYGPVENNIQPLIDRILLNDRRDAHFQFQGRATNLALKDMDNDSIFEIIAPTYDNALRPHLHIFRYNRESGKYEPYLE